MFAVDVSGVEKVYYPNKPKAVHALKGISLKVERGKMVAIMGASGSGKSTLLRIIGCLDKPSAGSVRLLGEDLGALTEKKRAALRCDAIGFVFQDFGLIKTQSALENVMLPMYFSKMKLAQGKEAAIHALKQVGLSDKINSLADDLSGGEQQRVAIARALANHSQLLLADEPTGALDEATGDEILDLFSDIRDKGSTVIIVTHNLHVAQRCDYIVRIADGIIAPET